MNFEHSEPSRSACAFRSVGAAWALTLVVLLNGAPGSELSAQDLIFRPINPSFGGSPLNSSHLMGTANAQKKPKRSAGSSPTSRLGTNNDTDLFLRQLKSRMLSSLASQVTEAVFGENPQESGTVRFGEQEVTFDRTLDSIRLVLLDHSNGSETVIEVPVLITQ